jgi:8-oxo-dGTP pyrophosphatase MutT (NUDIX family)
MTLGRWANLIAANTNTTFHRPPPKPQTINVRRVAAARELYEETGMDFRDRHASHHTFFSPASFTSNLSNLITY